MARCIQHLAAIVNRLSCMGATLALITSLLQRKGLPEGRLGPSRRGERGGEDRRRNMKGERIIIGRRGERRERKRIG